MRDVLQKQKSSRKEKEKSRKEQQEISRNEAGNVEERVGRKVWCMVGVCWIQWSISVPRCWVSGGAIAGLQLFARITTSLYFPST